MADHSYTLSPLELTLETLKKEFMRHPFKRYARYLDHDAHAAIVTGLFSQMGEKDYYCHHSFNSLAPELCDDPFARRAMLEAIERGARFIYLHPAADMEGAVHLYEDPKYHAEAVAHYAEELRQILVRKGMPEEMAASRLQVAPTNIPLLMTPGSDSMLFQPDRDNSRNPYGFHALWLPSVHNSRYKPLLPANDAVTGALSAMAKHVLEHGSLHPPRPCDKDTRPLRIQTTLGR